MDDAELLRAYAENRSETAFAGFVERRIGFVHTAALRMVAGNAHMAQDVTQAVFVLVANKAAVLARHERLAGWLYTTTRNVSRQVLRDARRRGVRELEAARMSEIEESNAAGIEAGAADVSKLRPMLDEALGVLREGEREAVLLRYFEGRAFAEIGAKLRMSEEAARKCVSRAVEKMRGLLAKRGVTSSAAAVGALMSAEAAQGAPAGLAASVSAGALTSAAATMATLAGTGGILAFMSSAKITALAVVALCIAGGTAYYGICQQSAAEKKLAAAEAEKAKLIEQLAVATEKTKNRASSNRAQSMWSSPKEADAALMAGRKLLAEHPEIKAKLDALGRAVSFAESYWVAQEMGLTDEQRSALAEIIANGVSWTRKDTSGYGTVILKSRYTEDSEHTRKEDRLREFFGEDGFEKYMELSKRYYAVSKYSGPLAAMLYHTDMPLTGAQAQAFAQVCLDLKKEQANYDNTEAWWSDVVGRASGFLSEKQIAILGTMADQYQSDYVRWQRSDAYAAEKAKSKSK